MRLFARNAGVNVSFPAGSVVFNKGDAGNCMYIVQSGSVEMVIGEKVVEVCGPNEAIGFMSVIDTARGPRRRASGKPSNSRSSISASSASWWTRSRTLRATSWARWRGASVA